MLKVVLKKIIYTITMTNFITLISIVIVSSKRAEHVQKAGYAHAEIISPSFIENLSTL